MTKGAPSTPFVEVGSYVCPNTGKLVPLLCEHQDVTWPVIVKNCQSCRETHIVNREDCKRPPVFGYE